MTKGEWQITLDAEPASVREARSSLEARLRHLDQDTLERVVLCASEVVTNAIEHGQPPIAVRVDGGARRVRVEVDDGSGRQPELKDPDPRATRGRGLLIVERCADRWGVTRSRSGKVVWFEVEVG